MTQAKTRWLAPLAAVVLMAGCKQVKYDQTGVRTQNFGPNKGIVDQDYGPGFHRFLWPLDTWHVLPSTVQHIHFAKEGWSPLGPTVEPLTLTSAGGDHVVVTAEVLFRVADGEAHHVLQESGAEERYREVVRGLAQDAARVQFGQLPTEDFYNAANREKAREAAANALRASLKPRGIELVDFLVETLEFDPNYEDLIKKKKIADQQVELEKAKGKAAEEAGKVERIKTETTVKIQKINQETEAQITQKGTTNALQIASLQVEASKYAKQKDAEGAAYASKQRAEGQKLIKEAEAEGARRMNEALSGEGGRNVVALEAVQQMNIVDVVVSSVGFDWFSPLDMARRLGGLGGPALSPSAEKRKADSGKPRALAGKWLDVPDVPEPVRRRPGHTLQETFMAWLAFQFVVGVLLLKKSADWFVRGASRVAKLAGLPRVFIGVALVGFATNLPELAVSAAASFAGQTEIALGNAIGSNTFNTGLILGLCLVALNARFEPVWLRDYGIPMLFSCAIMYLLAVFGDVTRFMGLIYVLLCAAFVTRMTTVVKREPVLAKSAEEWAEEAEGGADVGRQWRVVGLLLAISLPIIWISSKWLLSTSTQMARLLGISESVIALTLVSAGTSLPELATSWAACKRGHYDTSVGLIFGSNIYNVSGVIGCSGLIHHLPYTAAHRLYDIPVMIVIQVILLAPVLWNRSPGRKTGYALLIVYGLYVYSLFTLYGIFS